MMGSSQDGRQCEGYLASRVCPLTFGPCCVAATCLTSSWQEARTEQRAAGCVQKMRRCLDVPQYQLSF